MSTTTPKKKNTLDETYNTVAQVSNKANSMTGNQEGIKQLSEYKNLVNQKTSALSSVGQANKIALKHADTQALAQGYATQGAAMQNVGNLQNAYINQVGGINQQYQQQLGSLQDTASQRAFTNFEAEASNIVGNAKSEQEVAQGLNKLIDAYGSQMNTEQLGQAQRYIDTINKGYEEQNFNVKFGLTGDEEGISVQTILNSSGKANKVLGKGTGNEYKLARLQDILRTKTPENGTTFKVKNKYYVYKNGNLIEINSKNVSKPDFEI